MENNSPSNVNESNAEKEVQLEKVKLEREPMPKLNKKFFIFLAFIFGITVAIAGVSVVLDLMLYEGRR